MVIFPSLKLKIKAVYIFTLVLLAVTNLSFADVQAKPVYIRVRILDTVPTLHLKAKGFYDVVDYATRGVIYRGKNLNTTVTVTQNAIRIGTTDVSSNNLLIKAHDNDALSVNGRNFRGDIQIINKNGSELMAINHVTLDDYIQGILYHEVSHYWPYEALKAQAIVCRTYAVYQIRENKAKDYDLTNDIYSQVYGGRTSERYRTNKAVRYTEGQILTYNNKAVPAYFHSCCGGHTEDASLLWKTDLPPLKGGVCGFCIESPHYQWHNLMKKAELEAKLAQSGRKVANIQEITIAGRDASGRITNLKIISEKGETSIPAKDFRHLIGPNIIRSTNFSANIVGEDIIFEGIGWGHGVGLCQWGAYFMAKEGHAYPEILQHYYPGTEISLINDEISRF